MSKPNEAKRKPAPGRSLSAAARHAAPAPRQAAPGALWLMTAEPGSALEEAVFALWRAVRAKGWDVSVALPWRSARSDGEVRLRRAPAFGAPAAGAVLERWPIEVELGPGEFRGEVRRTAGPDADDRLYWLVPQSADLAPASTSAFLCAGALDLARRDNRRIVHLFGLRAALAPILLSTRLGADPRFDGLRTVLSVDSIGDDVDLGRIRAATLHDLGLPSGLLEEPLGGVGGEFSALKGGIVFADRVVVPSPSRRRSLEASAAGRAARERGSDLVTIAWPPASPSSPPRRTPKRAAKTAPARPAAESPKDPVAAALARLATLYRGLLRRPARRIEVSVPPRAAAEAPDAPPPLPPAEPFIDWGPALPESYGEDACELLVQSPRGLYAYWEVSPETQRSAGGDLVLRLRSRVGERELGRMPSAVGEWWIEVEPGDVYVLDLVASDGRVLLRSAPARPPAAGPSPRGEVRMVHRDRVLAAAVLHAPATAAPAPRAGPQALARPEAWRLAPLPALAPAEAEIDVALTEHPTVDQPPAPSHHASGLASATGLASADGAVDPTGPAGVAGSGSGAGPSAGRGSSEQRPRRAS